MKNQVNYFEKVVSILKELKKEHPDVEVSKHISLATDDSIFGLTDKELFLALQKHKCELDMNTVSDHETEKILKDTDELFNETDPWLDEED